MKFGKITRIYPAVDFSLPTDPVETQSVLAKTKGMNAALPFSRLFRLEYAGMGGESLSQEQRPRFLGKLMESSLTR
ncbi:hypothetical protein D5R40_31405 [Okeania hirsuta]|uniref:Uncharacterized protein n=1 Tax=Okeania hirsuta TaxID=1458930 RepID=A0A3N6NUU1_9CYAN|nr:hypothetical protein D5R40_31405 [Okeania hirsuta]